jgi:ABC-2 type transport system permease protein
MELNLRGGWALIKATWARWVEQRSFFFLLAFGWMIPPLIYLFVWTAAAGQGTIGGLNRSQFVGYYLVLILVNQFTYPTSNWTVGDLIRYGWMSRVLLRPMPFLYDAVGSDIAGKVVFMLFDIPVVMVLALFLRPEIDAGPGQILAFLPALLLAVVLRFFWGYWLALLAFWTARANGLLMLQDALIFLLAGQVAPVALLPGALQAAAQILPFRYMVSFPVEILTGQLTQAQLTAGFAVQTVWVIVALILTVVIWKTGIRRFSAVGG